MPPLTRRDEDRHLQVMVTNPAQRSHAVATGQQSGTSGTIPGTSSDPTQPATLTGTIQSYPNGPSPNGDSIAGVGHQVLNNAGNPVVVMGNLNAVSGGGSSKLPSSFQDGGFSFVDAAGNQVAGYSQETGLYGFPGGLEVADPIQSVPGVTEIEVIGASVSGSGGTATLDVSQPFVGVQTFALAYTNGGSATWQERFIAAGATYSTTHSQFYVSVAWSQMIPYGAMSDPTLFSIGFIVPSFSRYTVNVGNVLVNLWDGTNSNMNQFLCSPSINPTGDWVTNGSTYPEFPSDAQVLDPANGHGSWASGSMWSSVVTPIGSAFSTGDGGLKLSINPTVLSGAMMISMMALATFTPLI